MRMQVQEKLAMKERKPDARTSVSDGIVEQMVDLISRDVLKPGDRLPSERELCKRLGVGRSSLREALRSLAVMGIIDGRVGDGTLFLTATSGIWRKRYSGGCCLTVKGFKTLSKLG